MESFFLGYIGKKNIQKAYQQSKKESFFRWAFISANVIRADLHRLILLCVPYMVACWCKS